MPWQVAIKPEVDSAYGFSDWADAVVYTPANINYIIRSGLVDPCSIAFTIGLDDPFLSRDQFGPWRSDWRLLSPGGDLILQGVITKVSINQADQAIQVAGEDYLTLLKRAMYPFNYTTFITAASELGLIFTPLTYSPGTPPPFGTSANAIINIVQAYNGDVISTVGATLAAESTFTVNPVGTFSPLTNYTITPGDDTTIFDHIAAIGQQDGQLGFDLWCDTNRTIQLFSDFYEFPPSKYAPIEQSMLIDLQWANNGPAATRTVGFGAFRAISSRYDYLPVQQRFRVSTATSDYGDNFISQDIVTAKTAARGKLNQYPQHDMQITIYADQVTPLGGDLFYKDHAGVVLQLDSSAFHVLQPFHNPLVATANYRATELNFVVSNVGDNICTATLEQIYINDPGIN